MRVDKLLLRNFSNIKLAMNTDEIEIDFTTAINTICLLIGPNGSGKTSLLSYINPFAGLGNLDIRDGEDLILKDKEGYKEIHIRNKKDLYVIKHFYTPHKDKSHSVNSYISLNETELNPNGNVTSFKEIVKEELGIEPEYLKLLRLGNNVTSLIDLSPTERKTFMGKILDDIDIFLFYYKKINNDLRQLKELISHDVNKLNRLGIDDKTVAKKEISNLESEMEQLTNRFNKLNGDISIYLHEIEQIKDTFSLKDRLKESIKLLNKMEKILAKKDTLESTDVAYYENKINEMEKRILINKNELSTVKLMIQTNLTTLDRLQGQYRTINIQYNKEQEKDKELERMEHEMKNLIIDIRQREDNLDGFVPDYTLQEFNDFYVFLKNTQQILRRTYEFGKKPIGKVVELIGEGKNVITYINNKLMDIDDRDDDNAIFLRTLAKRFNFDERDFPCTDDTGCKAKGLWIQVGNLLRARQEDKDKKEDSTFYHDMELVYQNLKTIIPTFSEWKSLIDRLPKSLGKQFTVQKILKKISELDVIYDEKVMNDMLAITTEYQDYLNLLEKKKELQKDIDRFVNLSSATYLLQQLNDMKDDIDNTTKDISMYKNKVSELTELIDEEERDLEYLNDLRETFKTYTDVVTNTKELLAQYDTYVENSRLMSLAHDEMEKIKKRTKELSQEIQIKKSSLDQYKVLKKELKDNNEIYDEMSLTKEALSSKRGMHRYYIKHYLRNTREITNDLLDIVYEGDIYIDDFNITPTEFSIPFYNKGKLIKDVKYASQGELSFLTTTLSFALSTNSLSKYNIMLLDEIDGPLDIRNREKFIRIVENQSKRVNAEQLFVITHNNMYQGYPVDIIDLDFESDKKNNSYELGNYIKVTRRSL